MSDFEPGNPGVKPSWRNKRTGAEPKIVFKHRLLEDGRWQQFKDMREELLIRGDIDKKEADRLARAAFPPNDGIGRERYPKQKTRSEMVKGEEPPFLLEEATEAPDHLAALEWVAANWSVKKPDLEGAPNSVAIGLFRWAKSSATAADKFWIMAWPKLLPDKRSRDEFERRKADGNDVLGLLAELSAKAREDEEPEEEESDVEEA